jgi:hypothetical protein
MTIYAVHHYNRNTETVGALEAFPSVERASVALQLRARKQSSGTFFVHEDTSATPRPEVAFPEADMTGYLLVWRRKAGEPRPEPGDEPEEVWRLSPGGAVIKEPYNDGGREYTLPQLTPEERREKALKFLADVPPLSEAFLEDLDPTWKRTLRDLVQDDQAEDAILRVMQMIWYAERGKGQ